MVVALGVGGSIKNLTIGSGSHFRSCYLASSVVVNNNGGKVINCHSAATVEGIFLSGVSGMDFSVGGVVANNWSDDGKNSYVIGCSFSGQVIVNAGNSNGYRDFFVGGVVASSWTTAGNNSNRAHVVGCINTGGVTFQSAGSSTVSHVGGVVGSNYQNHGLAVVTGCVMTGKMTFSNVEKRQPWYSAFDATVGEIQIRRFIRGGRHRHHLGDRYGQHKYRYQGLERRQRQPLPLSLRTDEWNKPAAYIGGWSTELNEKLRMKNYEL